MIVGQNGCGKTTIIECLKYATTGISPPGAKTGGAFIHDPKLCGDNPVKAQVKLQFRPVAYDEKDEEANTRLVVTRSLELVVNRGKPSTKTLDGTLLTSSHGTKTTVSKKNAQLDIEVPRKMGVSAAILDNVVFCHQDESLWPLSEAKKLKEKFDEIFDAVKYTKAVDNIKGLVKAQTESLKRLRTVEGYEKTNKTKAEKAKKDMEALRQQIEKMRIDIHALDDKTKEADEKRTELYKRVHHFDGVIEKLKVAHKNRGWYENQLQSLRAALKERPEPDDVLQNEFAQWEERKATLKSRMEQQGHRWQDLKGDIDRVRGAQSDKRLDLGKFAQEKATYEKRVREREQAVQQGAHDHGIHGFNMELDEMQINEFMDKIMRLSKEQTSKIERLRRDNQHEAQKIQGVLDDLHEERTSLREGKKSAKDLIASNDRRTTAYHMDLEKIATDEAGKASLQANVEDLESRLRIAMQHASSGSAEAKICDRNKQLQKLESDATDLNQELFQGTKLAGDLARLDHLKKEAKDRQRSIETMSGAHGDRLNNVVGADWQPATLENAFQKAMHGKKQEVAASERQRDSVSKEQSNIEFQLQTARKDLRKNEEEIDKCASRLRDAMNREEGMEREPDEYPEELTEAQNDRDVRRADVDAFSNMRDYFMKAIETAQSDHSACRLCTRPFEDKKLVRQFVSRLEKQMSKGAFEGLQSDLKACEADLKKMTDAGPSYETWKRLSEKENPRLKTEISKLEQQCEGFVRQLEQHDRTVGELEDARRDAETLAKPVATIVKAHGDLQSYNQQIQTLTGKQKDTAASRTLEDIRELLEANSTETKDVRAKIEKLQSDDRQRQEAISSVRLELESVRSKLASANHDLEKRESIEQQIADLKTANQQQRRTVYELDANTQELEPRLGEQTTKQDAVRARGEVRERELQKDGTKLKDTIRVLEQAGAEIASYRKSSGSNRLDQCRRDIEAFDQEISSLEKEQKQVTVEINKMKDEESHQDETRRVIDDNLRFRKHQRELQALDHEIAELSAHNAERDQADLRQEAEHWDRQHKIRNTEETSLLATMRARDDQLTALMENWQTDYVDAHAKYRRARIDVVTTAEAKGDLEKYGSALDKAVIRFHAYHMDAINQSLRDLWQTTYQGSDVDAIRVRSESESAGGRSNRAYNYRVVMVKGDAEMDMRGRCSAGQKVLASILIRLALAECFGNRCGLVALDEPTTNLDRDNVHALAKSLNALIKQRRSQKNFQLLIITHDEDFLRYIRPQDFCDDYWRVSRNGQQKSIIEKQSISRVLEN